MRCFGLTSRCELLAAILALSACDTNEEAPFEEAPRCLAEVATYEGNDELTITVDWSPNSNALLVGTETHLTLMTVDEDAELREVATFSGHTDRVYAHWSPDGHYAITGSDDESIKLLRIDLDTPAITELDSMWLDGGAVYASEWSPDGRTVLAGTAEGDLLLLAVDTETGTLGMQAIATPHEGKVFSVAWSPDGTRVLSASGDHTVRLFDVSAGQLEEIAKLEGPEEFVPLAWAPDGARAAAGTWGATNAVYLLEVGARSLDVITSVDLHDSGSRALAWRGDLLATGAHDHHMHLLQHDPLTDELVELVELEDEGIGVHALSWSPDGTRVARVSSKQDRVSIVRVGHDGC